MVALLRHQPISAPAAEPRARHLRLVGGIESAERPRVAGPAGGRPGLGGPSGPVRRPVAATPGPLVAARPTAVVVAAVAISVFGFLGLVRGLQGGPGVAVGSADGPAVAGAAQSLDLRGLDGFAAAVTPVADGDVVVTVGPGDSLWSIARSVEPDGDPRPLVSALIEANGGSSLQIGQQIVIPGHLLD